MQTISARKGSALIISLVILTVITLGAVVAMQRSTLQVRMVGSLQHQQKIFNAAYSDLGGMFDQLRSSSNLTTVLNDTLTAYYSGASPVNPYASKYGLSKPASPDNVKPVASELIALEPSTSLKANEGSSGGSVTYYYFTSTAAAIDNNDNVGSTQQIGFYFMAPVANQ